MTYQVIFLPRARQHLIEISDYIEGEASLAIARNFVSDIISYCNGFDVFPQRGMARDDIYPGLRLVGFRKRVTIAFAIEGDRVLIIGVFYGGQDYESALSAD